MNCFCALARSPFLISSFFLCTKKDTFKDFNRFVLSLNESPFIALTWWHWKNSREKPMGWTSWFLLYWQDEHQQEGECWTEGLWKTELGSLGDSADGWRLLLWFWFFIFPTAGAQMLKCPDSFLFYLMLWHVPAKSLLPRETLGHFCPDRLSSVSLHYSSTPSSITIIFHLLSQWIKQFFVQCPK